MIVLKHTDELMLFEQHYHGLASGVMAHKWKDENFLSSHVREEVEYAISFHDRGWVPLDQKPAWDQANQQPYSFYNYPMREKMERYHEGVDEVEKQSIYASLLCSMHYCSFFDEESDDEDSKAFLTKEYLRQEKLKKKLGNKLTKDSIQFHFTLLQFCDDLSLYCCMNEPGSSKQQEVSWFKNGFRQQFPEAPNGIMPRFENEGCISLDPFPFTGPFELTIPYKAVRIEKIEQLGLEDARREENLQQRKVKFVPFRNTES
ncbi:DUF3891 family protein [Pontibacillus yanchengensis]|uniref:DUF3891 family protein n=2 Tax=Pontibacillus yanchengensis TaxID=462910 RepID=A0ACC7VHE9_9BACI|nr:DUF3891 family protein [Pontibacillus yanchengensis]MYL34405.1 DUF3891 family protein [Pontibacillus yanchengensis]MYL54213.1 DUF3891 family protein [Pontibacillus yanchengensis]